MLGWEFPPFIAGGLGVACYGLTRGLDQAGHRVTFILPKPVERPQPSHVRMLSPTAAGSTPAAVAETVGEGDGEGSAASEQSPAGVGVVPDAPDGRSATDFQHATFLGVPATFSHPYPGEFAPGRWVNLSAARARGALVDPVTGDVVEPPPVQDAAGVSAADGVPRATGGYGGDLIGDSDRYARLAVSLTRREPFDVIHAHDWLTFPAGLAVSRVTGRPLVVHVHSTEFDRSGTNVNQRVYDIERAGMHGADRVIAVSNLTKSICVRRYGVPPGKIDVVHNGIDTESQQPLPGAEIQNSDKIVLFLGRITMQKGPEYFIAAARRVLEKIQNVKFVIAGDGDMALRMVEMATNMGIGDKVLFTGFLRGEDVDRVFRMADCYVMPSVSEPFGIAALEAMSHNVPVIVSKTSGAAEVLTHVLKVDFWDIDEMANKIVAVLRHPPLGQTMSEHGRMELRRLTWTDAADRCAETYNAAIEARRSKALAGSRT